MHRRRLRLALEQYFQRRALIYLLVIIIFVMGSLFGTIAVNIINDAQQIALTTRLNAFFDGATAVSTGSLNVESLRGITLANITKLVGAIWVLGLSLIGSPLILLIIFTRGFILGFTTGFIVKKMGLKGVFMALVSLVPQNLFYIPAIIIMGVAGIAFTFSFLRSWRRHEDGLGAQFIGYTLVAVFSVLLMAGGALVEGYATPILISWINGLWG